MKFATKHKWLVFVLLIWAVIFSVPVLRYQLKVMATGSPWIQFTIFKNHYGDVFSNVKNPALPIEVWKIENNNQSFAFTNQVSALPQMDRLIAQNPNLPWLIALRLQMAAGAFQGNRQGGEWSEANRDDDIKKGLPPVEKNKNRVNFIPQQLQETVALCRRGEKLEPQNAYFNWMEFYFLMLDWQDAKARKALSEAASKSYWNNHQEDFNSLYVKAASDVLGRPLNPYEKISFDSLNVNFETNERTREMGRILGWEGVKLKRAGKYNEALQLWADSYHSMTLAAQGATNIMSFLMDYGMLAMAADGATYPSRETIKKGEDKKTDEEQRFKNFMAYANKYHRPDLARQFERDWQANHQLFKKTKTYVQGNEDYFSLIITLMQVGAILLALGVIFTLSILGTLSGWMLLECYRNFSRRERTFEDGSISADLWCRCKGIIACSGLPSFLLGMLFLVFFLFIIIVPLSWQYDFFSGWTTANFYPISSDIHLSDQILNIFSNLSDSGFFPVLWRLLIFLTPLTCGLFFVLSHSRENSTTTNSFWRALGRKIYLALLFLAWGLPLLTTEYNLPQIVLAAICIIFLLVSFFWMWRASRKNQRFALSLFQSSLTGWACTTSILIIALMIGQIVLNKRIQPYANNQLHGEMYLLHQVKDAPPA